MPKTIKAIKLIGNLSNKFHYEYSEEQVKKLINSLKTSLKHIKNKFS